MNFEEILIEAHSAASAAQRVENARLGPEADRGFDCGFAWVTVGGNEPIARWARGKLKADVAIEGLSRGWYGSKAYPSGWQWWKPGDAYNGQSISVFEAGAKAFRDTLAKYGIRADVGSRLD